jgi:hypothetical protein
MARRFNDALTRWFPRDVDGRLRIDMSGSVPLDFEVMDQDASARGVPRGSDGSVLVSVTGLPDSVASETDLAATNSSVTAAQTDADAALAALPAKADKGAANTFTAAQTFNADIKHGASAKVGLFGGLGITRIPFSANPSVYGPDAVAASTGGTNVGAFVLAPKIHGDFTGIAGADPGFAWGVNVFATTGSVPTAGITSLTGQLSELSLTHPSGTIDTATGFQADLAYFGAAAGGVVNVAQTLRVSAPRRKNGATSGTFGTIYTAFIESADDSGAAGTGGKFTLFTAGGIARLGGRLDVLGTILGYAGTGLSLNGGFSNHGKITLGDGTGSGEVTLQLGRTYDSTRFSFRNAAGATVASIDRNGVFRTLAHTAPADTDLVAGEMATWFDQTNGAAKFKVKAKQADGTVRTGEMALA